MTDAPLVSDTAGADIANTGGGGANADANAGTNTGVNAGDNAGDAVVGYTDADQHDQYIRYYDLFDAVQSGNTEYICCVKIPKRVVKNLLRLAIVNNRYLVVELLLASYPDILNNPDIFDAASKNKIIYVGVIHSSISIVKLLIEANCDIADEQVPYYAVRNGRSELYIHKLLMMKADLTSESAECNPLIAACENPNISEKVVKYLLENGASPEVKNEYDYFDEDDVDGADRDDEEKHYDLCTCVIKTCNPTVLEVLLSKIDLRSGLDSLLEGFIEYFVNLLNEFTKYDCDDVLQYCENLRRVLDILLPRTDIECVHRASRFVIGILIGWKMDEIACQTTCDIVQYIPENVLDTQIITYIKYRHNQFKLYSHEVHINSIYSECIARIKYGYKDKLDHVLSRLISHKVDIATESNQLLYMGTLSLTSELRFKSIQEAQNTIERISELLEMYSPPKQEEKQ
jgi:hypothetical protein